MAESFIKRVLRPFSGKLRGYRVQECEDTPTRIGPELAAMLQRALKEERDGKGVVMRDPKIERPKPPRRPSWER
jgi:hypothetical protein